MKRRIAAIGDGSHWKNTVNREWQRDFPYGFYNFDGIHVRFLVALGSQVFLGGNFSRVGSVRSLNFAILHDEDVPNFPPDSKLEHSPFPGPRIFLLQLSKNQIPSTKVIGLTSTPLNQS
jgi:hypothetical protein